MIVDRLRGAVLDDGRSLRQIAEQAGLTAGALSRFVRGENGIGLEAAERLAEALGLHLGVRGAVAVQSASGNQAAAPRTAPASRREKPRPPERRPSGRPPRPPEPRPGATTWHALLVESDRQVVQRIGSILAATPGEALLAAQRLWPEHKVHTLRVTLHWPLSQAQRRSYLDG